MRSHYKENATLFNLVCTEMKLVIPFLINSLLVEVMLKSRVELGSHYPDFNGATRVTFLTSNHIHMLFEEYLTSEEPLFLLSLTT